MESDDTQFEMFRSVIVTGIRPQRDPPLFPTLIIENADGVDVNVLEPVPDYPRVRAVTSGWLANMLDSDSSRPDFCLAFAVAHDKIELQTRCSGELEIRVGEIDQKNESITWNLI